MDAAGPRVTAPAHVHVTQKAYAQVMADCAAVGCSEHALEVWRPTADDAPRFHYLVCQFHALALRSEARYTVEGRELRIASLPRLRDWNVTQAGGQAIVGLVYGDELDAVRVQLEADPAMLRQLRESLTSMQLHEGDGTHGFSF